MKSLSCRFLIGLVLFVSATWFAVGHFLRLAPDRNSDTLTEFSAISVETSLGRQDCGPASLYLACRLLGIEASFEELVNRISPTDNGTTLLRLSQAASEQGIQVRPLHLSFRDLRAKLIPGHVSILHVEPGHFVLAAPSPQSLSVKIIDPARKSPVDVCEAELTKLGWRGICLFLFRADAGGGGAKNEPSVSHGTPYTPAKAEPPLFFEPAVVNLGNVYAGTKTDFTASVTNRSAKNIVLHRIFPQCGCTVATIDKQVLGPGESTQLHGRFESGTQLGAFRKGIDLAAFDQSGLGSLEIVGETVSVFRTVPSRLELQPDLLEDAASRKTLQVANSSSIHIRLKLNSILPDYLSFELEKAALAPGESAQIRVTAISNCAMSHSLNIRIATNHPQEPFFEIPITIAPRKELTFSPNSVRFGVLSKRALIGSPVQPIYLRGAALTHFKLGEVVGPSYMKIVVAPHSSGTQIQFDVRTVGPFLARDLSGTIRAKMVRLHDNKSFSFDLPVSGLLSDSE